MANKIGTNAALRFPNQRVKPKTRGNFRFRDEQHKTDDRNSHLQMLFC
jgi:hypothetical protein